MKYTMILCLTALIATTCFTQTQFAVAVGGTGAYNCRSVVQTIDEGFVVAGETNSFGAGSDFLIVKFDSDGNTCLGVDVSPTVTATSPEVTNPSPNPTVTDVSPTVTDVSPTVTEICTDDIAETIIKPQTFTLSASPNPFNSAVSITTPAGAKIEIYDVNGRRLAEC